MKKQIIIIAGLVSVIMTPPASAVTQCLPLDMDNCEVNGHFHGMFMRGGTAVIKNSTITNTLDDGGENSNYFDNRNWGTGNMVNLAALTLGDKSAEGSTSYQYPTNVTLENTTVQMAGSA